MHSCPPGSAAAVPFVVTTDHAVLAAAVVVSCRMAGHMGGEACTTWEAHRRLFVAAKKGADLFRLLSSHRITCPHTFGAGLADRALNGLPVSKV
ncbi:hypothetical protein MRX96_030751 [Rhipicephalus microplus]